MGAAKRRSIIRKLLPGLAALAVLAGYIIWGNTSIVVTELAVSSPDLPEEFSGYRIVQVSDLHNAEFGAHNQNLLHLIAQNQPDVVLLTGDLIDSRRTNVEIAAEFAAQAAGIAPTYYVTGNHEARVQDDYARLKAAMTSAGVHVLENELVTLERSGASISLLGLHDPNFSSVAENLTIFTPQTLDFTILLAHHPELIGTYAGSGIDLVFSGHAHGGQFRFPFIGGLFAPGQGFFPSYDAGLYTVENTQMIVSRGLGNSIFPFRLNNRPELVTAELNPA